MRFKYLGSLILLFVYPICWAEGPVSEADVSEAISQVSYSPYANRHFPNRVLWGDTHLHTDISMDAGAFGNRLGLDEAYRFARGEEVTSSNGMKVRLSRDHWTIW